MLRRAIGMFAAFVLASLAVGAQPVPAAAPVDGTLYGFAFPGNVVSIEPASGSTSTVASLAGVGPNPLGVALAPDVEASNVDALVATCTACPNGKGGGPVFWQIATINPGVGSVSAGAILQRTVADSIAVDPETHRVWGAIECFPSPCSTQTVALIDPASGAETDFATVPVRAFTAIVALAPKSHTLYVLANAQLSAVDTRTAAVTAGPSLGQGVTDMAVDASDGALFVVRTGLNQQDVERIDPSTGQSSVLATFNGLGLTSRMAIDSKSHTLFAEETVMVGPLRAFEIVSVNDRSGMMSTGKPIIEFAGPLAFLRD